MDLGIVLSVLIAFLVIFLVWLISYGRRYYGLLEGCGFPILKPYFLLGSRPNLHKLNAFQEDIKLYKEFGSIWGLYRGRYAEVYVADPQMIRLIFVQDSKTHFQNRDTQFKAPHPLIQNMLGLTFGEKWKILRKSLTPMFTLSKLKDMTQNIAESLEEFIGYTEKLTLSTSEENLPAPCAFYKSETQIIDTKGMFKILTSNILLRCIFASKLSLITNPDNDLVKNLKYMTGEGNSNPTFRYVLESTFPILFRRKAVTAPGLNFFKAYILELLSKRKLGNLGEKFNMIDVIEELMGQLNSPEFEKAEIDEVAILAQCMTFLFAGYFTSSNGLSLIAYTLAKFPEKQEKLLEEIDSFWEDYDGDEYLNKIVKLSYLNACIIEALRMYLPGDRPRRECKKTWTHNGITIKKGTNVYIPTLAVHYDPKFYSNPKEFLPERFLDESAAQNFNQFAYHTFGHGQRNCLGKSFFLLQAKLTFAYFLRKYKFEFCEETVLKFRPGRIATVDFDTPLLLKLVTRFRNNKSD